MKQQFSDDIGFALNQVAVPRLSTRDFIDMAASLGCEGVELRNDLRDKELTDREFFDGYSPAEVGEYVRSSGLRLLGLSEVYGFNNWSDVMCTKVAKLIKQAKESGAESISLIPDNSGDHATDQERLDTLKSALREIMPLLDDADMIALIEPLGFSSSSLRRKSEAIAAIEAVGGEACFKLVHDTFHHHLASESEFFAAYTGIVHISGVVDPHISREQMSDQHRILVDARDRLGTIEQMSQLLAQGYKGAFSFEPFSPAVHQLADPETCVRASAHFIRDELVSS